MESREEFAVGRKYLGMNIKPLNMQILELLAPMPSKPPY